MLRGATNDCRNRHLWYVRPACGGYACWLYPDRDRRAWYLLDWWSGRTCWNVAEQRDLYRVMHDQTLRMMSHGLTPNEIAEAFRMPTSLEQSWHARPYYGAIPHNLRAIYAHYMGPYDGNPVNLHPLPPEAHASKTIAYMGGAEAVLKRAQADFAQGDYRWVVQVGMQLVFADPSNQAARALMADAMEQLGYQAESATWRNAYLLGAKELRHGAPKPVVGGLISKKVVSMLPMDMFLDYLAVRVNAEKAEGLALRIDWHMRDEGTQHKLTLSHAALSHAAGSHGAAAQSTVSMTRDQLGALVASNLPWLQAFQQGLIPHQGDAQALVQLLETLDEFSSNFNILEP